MKEITRIHIAKTPYDIELAAKKSLEAYMRALEAYSQDTDIIEDVELRITEILEGRGIQKGGVVTAADVKALKEQLGDASEFMGEGDMAVGPETTGDVSRKLFRDTEHAIFGGVLSGIAAFFKINPVWVRLLFIVLALASFGTMLLVYVVLWIAVPPARTAADKLQMSGQPVTVRAIREMNENDMGSESASARADARQALFILLGIGCVFGALSSAAITVAALFGGVLFSHHAFSSAGGTFLLAAFVLALISGLLLTVLFTLGAYASFARKLTRRLIISICVVVVLGLATFGTAAGLAQYGSMRDMQEVQKNTHELTVGLPDDVRNATSLVADTPGMTVEYIVADTAAKPYASAQLFAYGEYVLPKVTTSMKNGVLTVKTDKPADDMCTHMWCDSLTQKVTIYGPALSRISADEDARLRYHANTQPVLEAFAARDSDITIKSGTIEKLQLTAKDNASVSADNASVSHVMVRSMNADTIDLGAVRSVELTDNDSCPAGRLTQLNVWNIAEGKIKVNGAMKPAKTMRFACTQLHVNDREDS